MIALTAHYSFKTDDILYAHVSLYRRRIGPDVQRRVRAGEPPLGRSFQAPTVTREGHSGRAGSQAEADIPQASHRHGAGHRHEQAHVPPGRSEDHGRGQESGRVRSAIVGQLQR